MDFKNRKHVITYVLVGGLVLYLLSAALSAVFIPVLPMADDWCRDSIEIERGNGRFETIVTDFKNDFEARKYYHNTRMLRRNKYLLFFVYLLAFGLTGLCFYLVPRWRGQELPHEGAETFFTVAIIAFGIAVVVPLVLGWLLPAPAKWFPQVFREIQDAQVNEALRQLR